MPPNDPRVPDPRSPFSRPATPPPTTPYTSAPTAPHAPAPGSERVVAGRYRLGERLGGGGMGTVWRAVDDVIGRTVAIKEPRVPEYLSEAERDNVHERMRREAKAAAGISHPNVVNVFDVAMENGRPWIVMEYVPGHSLADELTEGTLPPGRAAEIGLAVLEALGAANRAGILHRDVKPANVLLSPDGRVVLTDFGIARIEGEQPLTHSKAIIGSAEYMAPERVNGQRPGPASDLFSLGVLLYEAVEGWSPFRRGTSMSTMLAVRDEDVRPPRQAGPLTKPINGLLRKDPDRRLTVEDARRALRAAASNPPPAGAGDGTRSVPWWRRRSIQVAGAAAVAAGALAVLLPNVLPSEGGLPSGYHRHDEPKLHANIAVPGDYRRKVTDDTHGVKYTEPGGAITIGFWRTKEDDDGLSEARDYMAEYAAFDVEYRKNRSATPGEDDYGWVNLSNTKVGDTYKFHGSRAGTMDFTYQEWDSDTGAPAEAVHRKIEMVVVGRDGWTYDLLISCPAHGVPSRDGAEVYRNVRDNLHIDNL